MAPCDICALRGSLSCHHVSSPWGVDPPGFPRTGAFCSYKHLSEEQHLSYSCLGVYTFIRLG